MIDWGTVASSTVAAAIVAAILGPTASYFIVRHFRREDEAHIARVSEDLRRETRRIDAERASLEARFQTQYTWLYQERAKAMSEVYAALVDATDAFDGFTKSWGTLPGDARTPKDKWLAAQPAGQKFRETYLRYSLLFPEDGANALGEINRRFGTIFAAFRAQLYAAEGDEYKALLEMHNRGLLSLENVPMAIGTIERAFRRLYGTEQRLLDGD